MNRGRVYTETLGARDVAEGEALLDLLTRRYAHSSRDVWAEHVREGRVSLDGRTVTDPGAPVFAGVALTYARPAWREPDAPLELWALHADADLLILHKPSGLPTLPSEMYFEHTVLRLLARARPAGEGDPPAVPIHRLGVGTSGALVCSSRAAVRAQLGRALEAREVRKVYRALLSGHVDADAFDVDVPIGPVPHASWGGSVAGAVPAGGRGAKRALSHVAVLRRLAATADRGPTTLVEVTIPTGRPHQIRIHMAYAGHPLEGDPLYAAGGLPRAAPAEVGGGRPPLPRDVGYLLHAARVTLSHPSSGERLEVAAPPPAALSVEGELTHEQWCEQNAPRRLDLAPLACN